MRHRRRCHPGLLLAALAACAAGGCAAAPTNEDAVRAYYVYDFPHAREALRKSAYTQNDEQVLLNNLRLGLAALADGDDLEAERTLGRAFELLSTSGLNADRTTAAVLLNEGVRIWKGEPFEQALAYHYVATLYAVMGDWENARAASANALFRLTDFGRDQTPETLVREAARDEAFLDTGYTAVDTNFALGFLMQAIASDLSGAPGADGQLDAAVAINPDLEPLALALRRRDYDTLLIVDYGKGPTKIAYGPDEALVRFTSREDHPGRLVVHADGERRAAAAPVCDVDTMARDHRWNNLEDVRRAKSFIGRALIVSGAFVAASGARRDDSTQGLIGLGMILGGMVARANARGDTRHLEMLPRSVFLVPLRLEQTTDLEVAVGLATNDDQPVSMRLPRFRPGSPGAPRAVYLRLHGRRAPRPPWLTARALVHGNDHDGVRPGDWPWILGGTDVSAPGAAALEAYHGSGRLLGMNTADLLNLYRAEDILLGSGAEYRPDARRNPSYRHILEGGRGLFTPRPDSMGYKRLMYSEHAPFQPHSDLARNVARRERVPELAAGPRSVPLEESP